MPSTMTELLKTKDEARNSQWEMSFLDTIQTTKLALLDETPQPGPDGKPYLLVATENGTENSVQIFNWLKKRGIGMVVNPESHFPDYIFTYGMIWNFFERGLFVEQQTPFQKTPKGDVVSGEPSEEFLPKYVRNFLKEFLLSSGVYSPKITVLGKDIKFDLVFSLESLGAPPKNEHRGILEALAWFLPNHYSLSIASEKTISSFRPL